MLKDLGRHLVQDSDTRMGVEQVFVDAFNKARIYENKWKI